jgi:hypothetical protein
MSRAVGRRTSPRSRETWTPRPASARARRARPARGRGRPPRPRRPGPGRRHGVRAQHQPAKVLDGIVPRIIRFPGTEPFQPSRWNTRASTIIMAVTGRRSAKTTGFTETSAEILERAPAQSSARPRRVGRRRERSEQGGRATPLITRPKTVHLPAVSTSNAGCPRSPGAARPPARRRGGPQGRPREPRAGSPRLERPGDPSG